MIKNCLICKTDFQVILSIFERRKYCSKECMALDYKKRFTGKNSPVFKEKIQKECLYCKVKFDVPPSLKNKKFCSKKCTDANRSNGLTSVCEKCKKAFPVSPSRKKSAKFCSKNCQSPELLKMKCKTCKNFFEVLPAYRKRKFCSKDCFYQNEEFKEKMSEFGKNKKPTINQTNALKKGWGWGKGLTKENCPQIAKRAKILSKKYKGKAPLQFAKQWQFNKTPEGRRQNSERLKKYYAENPEKHINYILAQKGYETFIEKKMRFALEEKRISFERQYKIDRFWVDFALLEFNLAIEVDGEYWHQDKGKDAERDKIIESCGFKIIHFSGKQVNNDIDFCISRIQEILNLIR